jgi:hypothetical protein
MPPNILLSCLQAQTTPPFHLRFDSYQTSCCIDRHHLRSKVQRTPARRLRISINYVHDQNAPAAGQSQVGDVLNPYFANRVAALGRETGFTQGMVQVPSAQGAAFQPESSKRVIIRERWFFQRMSIFWLL